MHLRRRWTTHPRKRILQQRPLAPAPSPLSQQFACNETTPLPPSRGEPRPPHALRDPTAGVTRVIDPRLPTLLSAVTALLAEFQENNEKFVDNTGALRSNH